MGLFDKRTEFKPFEYPEITSYKDAINHSYWLVSEWNFLSDIHDFNVKLSESQRNTIKNAMLAISQIEVSVKRFWSDLGKRFPKAEFEQVGITFGECEVRHADAYSHLLQVLGLNDKFSQLLQNPVIQGRVDYLTKYLKTNSDNSDQNYAFTLTLFSIFVENVSLFSQFLVIKSFNKCLNLLKDIDNVVQATQKEECHSDDTEILTPDGWRLLADMQVGDSVFQYENEKLEPVKVIAKTQRYYEGDMYQIGHNLSNCLVTPEHDMVYFGKNNNLKKVKAKDISYHSKMRVPSGGVLAECGESKLSWEDKLRIAIQADGTTLYWLNSSGDKVLRGKNGGFTHSIQLTKKRKIERLRKILSHLPFEFVEKTENNKICFKIRYNQDYDYKNFDWLNFSTKGGSWCREFVEEAVGHRKNNVGFSTTNKDVADKVHAAAVLAGFRSNLLVKFNKRGYKETYKVTLSEKSLSTNGHGFKKEIEQYKGKVYCVTVPSGVIVTRRKGKVCIAGNCVHALFGIWIINQIKKEYPEWFSDEFYDKLYKACEKAYEAESKIIDWIFEMGELDFLTTTTLKNFIKNRFNDSLEMIGGKKIFEVNQEEINKVSWFEEEIYADVNTDFFYKKPVTYSKKVQSIQAEDIF